MRRVAAVNYVPMTAVFRQTAGAIADCASIEKTDLSVPPRRKVMSAGIMMPCPLTAWPIGFVLVELGLVTLDHIPLGLTLQGILEVWIDYAVNTVTT